jgi:hypothetical protein
MMSAVGMDPAIVAYKFPRSIVLNCLINVLQPRKNRLNSHSKKVLLCTHSHATRDEHRYPGKRCSHGSMLVIVVVIMNMSMSFRAKGMMSGFAHPRAPGNLSVL